VTYDRTMSQTRANDDVVFRDIVNWWAAQKGDAPFADYPGTGQSWTWREAAERMTSTGGALLSLGVGKGSVVAVQMHNTPQVIQALLGITALGALYSPLNPAFRGALLEHALSVNGAQVLICEPESARALLACARPAALRTVILTEPGTDQLRAELARQYTLLDWSEFMADNGEPGAEGQFAVVNFWDPYGVVFTSGTTGLSKGSVNSYAQLAATVEQTMLPWAQDDDVYQLDLPMFHVSGLMTFMTALQSGARLVVFPRPKIDEYWQRVRRHEITHVTMLPAIISFLWNQPPTPDETDHHLRRINIGRYPPYYAAWAARFHIPHVYIYYNMTETSSPLISALDPPPNIGAGIPRRGVEVRLVDEHDLEVAPGTAGELIVRTDRPWEMSSGYLNNPEATARAWRNGWFHTGDLFKQDTDGNYHLMDRLKDSIRRRGENISSFEVEREVLTHPAVAECAVTAVPSDHGDDEVMLWVLPKKDQYPTPEEIIRFVVPRLPYYMVPRYVELVLELPRTSSQRIHKDRLRERGVILTTWDREASSEKISLRSL
jgi:carnitine-CoA ligase